MPMLYWLCVRHAWEQYKNHCCSIQRLSENFPEDQFIIMGDFKKPKVTWLADPLRTERTRYLNCLLLLRSTNHWGTVLSSGHSMDWLKGNHGTAVMGMFRHKNVPYPLMNLFLLELYSNYYANYLLFSDKHRLARN